MPSLLAELERLGDRRQYQAWVAQCSEEADEDAVRVVREPLLACSAGELQREACLARPTRAGHRQQPRLLQQLVGVLELPLTAEKRGRRGGKVRVRDRPERRKLPVAELEQAHRLIEVLQPMRSQRGERESVAEQARRRLGHHNLAAVTRRHHPGTAMHVDTHIPLARQRRRTRMQTHPHPHRRRQQRRLRLLPRHAPQPRRRRTRTETHHPACPPLHPRERPPPLGSAVGARPGRARTRRRARRGAASSPRCR